MPKKQHGASLPRLYIRERMAEKSPPLSQDDMADAMGTTRGTVSKLLDGKMKMTLAYMHDFATVLNVSVPDLFYDPAIRRPTTEADDVRKDIAELRAELNALRAAAKPRHSKRRVA